MYNQDKTVNFYDKESGQYARKRYEGSMSTYTHYVFRKRMSIFFDFISYILKNSPENKKSLFDIGCADGIVLFQLDERFGDRISSIDAVDISEGMLNVARSKTSDKKFSFYIRGNEPQRTFDIVSELGVHVVDIGKEMEDVMSKLNKGGYFVYSTANRNSIFARLKLHGREGTEYVNDYRSLVETEKVLTTKFEIVKKVSYGLFIPKLWSIPFLARIIQPAVDFILGPFVPSLFHETLYLLRTSDKE